MKKKYIPYRERLKDPRWRAKREVILKRDGHKCVYCEEEKNLNIHHGYYEKGLEPWDYPDETLWTLCAECHGHVTKCVLWFNRNAGRLRPFSFSTLAELAYCVSQRKNQAYILLLIDLLLHDPEAERCLADFMSKSIDKSRNKK